jgi:hypothetical protein
LLDHAPPGAQCALYLFHSLWEVEVHHHAQLEVPLLDLSRLREGLGNHGGLTCAHGLCATRDHSENYSSESCTVRYGSRFKNNYFAEICSGSDEGSYSRLIEVCITQL